MTREELNEKKQQAIFKEQNKEQIKKIVKKITKVLLITTELSVNYGIKIILIMYLLLMEKMKVGVLAILS